MNIKRFTPTMLRKLPDQTTDNLNQLLQKVEDLEKRVVKLENK